MCILKKDRGFFFQRISIFCFFTCTKLKSEAQHQINSTRSNRNELFLWYSMLSQQEIFQSSIEPNNDKNDIDDDSKPFNYRNTCVMKLATPQTRNIRDMICMKTMIGFDRTKPNIAWKTWNIPVNHQSFCFLLVSRKITSRRAAVWQIFNGTSMAFHRP